MTGAANWDQRARIRADPAHDAILDSPRAYPYNPVAPWRHAPGLNAQVAQSVEHCTENAGVGGSIPPLGTKFTPA